MTAYDRWARFYDSIYSYVREDIPFYVREAKKSGGPVLELGCGTGRVTIPIARAGVDVVGLDNSNAMLEAAKRKVGQIEGKYGEVDLRIEDMRRFDLGRAFPLIVIPFRGFLELLTIEDQIECLSSVERHLAPDGRLIFNIFSPDPEMLVEDEDAVFHLRDVTDPGTGHTFVIWQQTKMDTFHQVMSVRLMVDEIDRIGAVERRFYCDYQLRYAHRIEILHLLARCGYAVDELYGGFDYSPFDEESGEMVWIARIRR